MQPSDTSSWPRSTWRGPADVLVLTRRVGESITIGDDVIVTVLEVRGGQVRLGIEAPTAVTVLRSEINGQIAERDKQGMEPVQDEPRPRR